MKSAKTSQPRLHESLSRTRHFSWLDCARRRSPLIWVEGPAGSGKTTLIANYAQAHSIDTLWYRVDPGDIDTVGFFQNLIEAAASGGCDSSVLPRLTSEYASGLETFAQNFFRRLCVLLKTPSLLVFDSYQEVSSEAALHKLLAVGMEQLPEGINVVVASREAPHAAFARLRANSEISILGWEDLRLTEKEVEEIVTLREGSPPSPERVELLHARARGWAAGLVLLLEQGAQSEAFDAADFGVPPQAVFDYFAGEIFDRLDPVTCRFLTEAAVLPTVAVTIADRLTGLPAQRILEALNRRHFFTERLAQSDPVYQFHPLFREFLIQRACLDLDAKELIALRIKAAAVLEEAGEVEEALNLLLDAGAFDVFAQRLLEHGPLLIGQGRNVTVESWLQRLPQQSAVDPELNHLWALARLPFNPGAALALIDNAFTAYEADGNREGMLSACCIASEAIFLEFADVAKLDSWIERFETLLVPGEPPCPIALEAQVAYAMFNALVVRRPGHPEIVGWERRAEEHGLTSTDPVLRLKTGYILAVYRLWMGRYADAGAAVATLRASAQPFTAVPLVQLSVVTTEALYETLAGSPRRALQKVTEGIELARSSGVHVWDHMLRGHGVAAALTLGEHELATNLLQDLEANLPRARPIDHGYYWLMQHWAARLPTGQMPVRASPILTTLLNNAESSGLPWGINLARLQHAEELNSQGDLAEASERAASVLAFARRCRSYTLEISTLLLQSDIAYTQGHVEEASTRLARAMELACRQGVYNFFGWLPGRLASFCARALAAGIEPDFVRSMIRRRNLQAPESSAVAADEWPFRVRIYTLGRFSLSVEENVLTFSGKAQKKPLELLKALIAFGGRAVPEERLVDALWPEFEGDLAHQNLKAALHRVRKLIGAETLVLEGGRLSLDAHYCWVDAWAFEQRIGQVLQSSIGGDIDAFCRVTDAVMSLYHGPFLANEDAGYALAARERLRGKLLRALSHLSQMMQDHGMPERSIPYLEQGLDVDPLTEPFYQGLMRAHLALGHRAEVLKTYERCQNQLDAGLGVSPSTATEALRRQAMQF